MDESKSNIDIEFKRYLQILRPYLSQLIDQDIIDICNAWIQRLSACYDSEKRLRNKYIFALCYQLARGILNEPFLKPPPEDDLPFISDEFQSECSTEVEYVVINSEDRSTKLLYKNKKTNLSETELQSQDNEYDDDGKDYGDCESQSLTYDVKSRPSRKQNIICYVCPKMIREPPKESGNESDLNPSPVEEEYEFRATNLIMKLREIKRQNMLLHSELIALKEESKAPNMEGDDFSTDRVIKAETATSTRFLSESVESVKCLKQKIADEKERTNFLYTKIENMQQQLDFYDNMKKQDFQDLISKHQIEIIKVKASIREECHKIEEDHTNQIKKDYESKISDIKCTHEREIQSLKHTYEEKLREKEKLVEMKDLEMANLRNQMEGANLKTILSKILEKPNENVSSENEKLKAQEYEKRMNKMEKSKVKCVKFYEGRLACLQREKHLTECSLQLHLVRQRAQVINEASDEHHAELTTALDKLEAKYKEIVANVQTTAIQRRMQDQAALEAILTAAFGPSTDVFSNTNNSTPNQFSPKTSTAKRDSEDHRDSEMIAALLRQQFSKPPKQEVPDKSLDMDSEPPGYCLDGERLGELFQKVYVPQRDIGDCGK